MSEQLTNLYNKPEVIAEWFIDLIETSTLPPHEKREIRELLLPKIYLGDAWRGNISGLLVWWKGKSAFDLNKLFL